MNPNPTHARTDNPGKGEKGQPAGQASRGQKTPNQQQPPPTDKRRGGPEQDERVRRSNQAGDQDVDDSGDGQGPDGVR